MFVYLVACVWCMYYRGFDCRLGDISTNIDISFRAYLKLIVTKLIGETGANRVYSVNRESAYGQCRC